MKYTDPFTDNQCLSRNCRNAAKKCGFRMFGRDYFGGGVLKGKIWDVMIRFAAGKKNAAQNLLSMHSSERCSLYQKSKSRTVKSNKRYHQANSETVRMLAYNVL